MPSSLDNFWFIQSIGIVAMVFSIWSWNSSTRKKILSLQAINAFFFVIHFALLGALSGAIMSAIIFVRNLVFIKKEDAHWARHKIWIYIFITLSIIGLLFSWKGMASMLPAVAVILVNFGFYQDKPGVIRIYALVGCVLWIFYSFFVHSYSGVISNTVAAIGIMVGMYRLDRKNKAEITSTTSI